MADASVQEGDRKGVNGETHAEHTNTIVDQSTTEPKSCADEADSVPSNGPDVEHNQLATETDRSNSAALPSSSTDSKKRKYSAARDDDRDWRTRRDEDNARDRDQKRDRDSGHLHQRRSRGGGKWTDYRENIKTDYTRPESRDPDEIRKQVEFYFSDSNLPTDKFLLDKTGGSANRPVPIKVLHSFKRMRHFQPYSAIVEALRESKVLNINDNDEVTRKEALPAELDVDPNKNVSLVDDKTRSRSIYAKGFGEEGPSTQFDIEAFFAPYGPTNAIRLRRHFPEKTFKGSVFVEFDTDETAKQFLALENKPKWDGRDLLIMSKEEYVLGKAKDIQDGKVSANLWRGRGGGRGRGRGGRGTGRDGRGRGGRDRDGRDTRDKSKRGGEDRRPENADREDEGEGSAPKGADSAPKHSSEHSTEDNVEAKKSDGSATTVTDKNDSSAGQAAPVSTGDSSREFDAGDGSKKRTREINDDGLTNEQAKKIKSQ